MTPTDHQESGPRGEVPGPVHVVARWKASSTEVDAVREILVQLSSASLGEPGCTAFRVLESVGSPGEFTLVETYAGPEARREHVSSSHFRDLVLRRAVPLLTDREIDEYAVVAE